MPATITPADSSATPSFIFCTVSVNKITHSYGLYTNLNYIQHKKSQATKLNQKAMATNSKIGPVDLS